MTGLLRNISFSEASLTLQAGDLLVCYTDGISEAMTIEEEEWGEERMISAVNGDKKSCAEDILSAMFRAADEFTSGAPQHDDMTLLVMKVLADHGSQGHD